MSESIVIGYDDPDKAQRARQSVIDMSKEYLVDVADAVVATTDEEGKIKLDQMVNLWTVGVSGGAIVGDVDRATFPEPFDRCRCRCRPGRAERCNK